MQSRSVVLNHLKNAKLMQISTVIENSPWICTVNFVFDKDLNLFWMSLRNTRHSKEIEQNSTVAVAIVIDSENKIGLQMQGTAIEVKGEELEKVHKIYCETYGDKPQRLIEAQSNDQNVRGYYKVSPTKLVIFNEESSPEQQEVDLSK